MSKPNLLIIWCNYYQDLAKIQLDTCVDKLKAYPYSYEVETMTAGTYEIPAVITHYQKTRPFDAYLPLSLLLKGHTDHYEFIWEHIKTCFIQLTLEGLVLGNGIITAPDMNLLQNRVLNGERVQEAIHAIDYLMRLKKINEI